MKLIREKTRQSIKEAAMKSNWLIQDEGELKREKRTATTSVCCIHVFFLHELGEMGRESCMLSHLLLLFAHPKVVCCQQQFCTKCSRTGTCCYCTCPTKRKIMARSDGLLLEISKLLSMEG